MGTLIRYFCFIVGGFLLGGVMFSRYLPMLLLKKDVCTLSADGNPGAGNVFTSCGWKMGLLCLFADMAKGFLPVFAAWRLFGLDPDNILFAAVMAAPVAGHAIAPLCKKGGGKCISTAFGVVGALFPMSSAVLLLAGIYVLLSTAVKVNPIRVRSIVTFLAFGVLAMVLCTLRGHHAAGLGCAVVSAIVAVKHLPRFCTVPKDAPENPAAESCRQGR